MVTEAEEQELKPQIPDWEIVDVKGVRHYRLDVFAPDALGEAKQVGSCDGGTRRITYQRLPAETVEAVALSATDPRR